MRLTDFAGRMLYAGMVIVCALVITSCAATLALHDSLIGGAPRAKSVRAGQLYTGENLNIRAPNSDGWLLAGSSVEGMHFARRGTAPNESFAAQVLLFIPSTAARGNRDEFLSSIKKQFEAETIAGRFSAVESEFKHAEERSYLCVSARSVIKDTEARVSPTRQEVLLLQAKSLYCQHPKNPYMGFALIYSHRGQSLYPNLDAEAQSFIDGVQVPSH